MPTRRFVVSRAEGGRGVADVLASQLNLPPAEARRLVQSGRVRLSAVVCPDPGRRPDVRCPATGTAVMAKPSS